MDDLITRGNESDILLHAFYWNLVKTKSTGAMNNRDISWYKVLTKNISKIAKSG